MNIALIGYGRMGHAVRNAATARGHKIVSIDPTTPDADFKEINEASLKGVDVCIDFTTAQTAIPNATKINHQKKDSSDKTLRNKLPLSMNGNGVNRKAPARFMTVIGLRTEAGETFNRVAGPFV